MREKLSYKFFGIPVYGYFVGIGLFLLQRIFYSESVKLSRLLGIEPHYVKIDFIDARIPLIPIFFTVYVISYFFWILGPAIAAKCENAYYCDFVVGMIAAYVVGACIFVFYPTIMDRAAEGLLGNCDGVWNRCVQFVYKADGGKIGSNLMPSYHCLISTCCYLAVHRRTEISKIYRVTALILTILICASTVFIKQHYFIDIPTGVIIAYITWKLSVKYHWGRFLAKKQA